MIVTLLTDYGLGDEFAGVCRGVIARIAPDAQVVDITHGVPRHGIREGALALRNALPYFPVGVHMAVVDPQVGTERRAVAVSCADGRLLVGPDNGLLSLAWEGAGGVTEAVDVSRSPFRLEPVSATFHGRDLFAPAAAALACGTPLEVLGQPLSSIPERLTYTEPHYEGKSVVGEIVYVDRFGTLVTNLDTELVPSYAVLEVEGLEIGPLRRTFGDVPTGGLLAYVGSDGAVEIAVRDGSAARRLGMGVGGRIRVRLG